MLYDKLKSKIIDDVLQIINKSFEDHLEDLNLHVQEVCQQYLSVGNTKILIIIPTEKKVENKLPSDLDKLIIPTGCQVKYLNIFGLPVAEAYNSAVQNLLNDGADYMLTVEDDTYPPEDALCKLLLILKNRKDIAAVGAWYPKKNKIKEGVHIIIGKDGKRTDLKPSGKLELVYTLCQGCTLFRAEMFKYISYPYFFTSDTLTQDSFFSEKARKMGYKLYCDSSIKCRHIDRVTGEVFE